MKPTQKLFALLIASFIASPVFADNVTAAIQPDQPNATQTVDTEIAQPTQAEKVNINSATAKELLKVKGITAPKARAILSYRKKHGGFKTVDELAKVRGFSRLKAVKLEAIKAQITI